MAEVTISSDSSVTYPLAKEFSPDTQYPEYPFGSKQISAQNNVYELVRRCLFETGSDRENYNTSKWNPLGQWIKPGDEVFILPNFIIHKRPFRTLEQFQAKVTHASVIRAVFDYAIIATGDPNSVSFGNAAVQNCDYSRISRQTGAESVNEFYRRQGYKFVGPYDLRLLKTRYTFLGTLVKKEEYDINDQAVEFDLGRFSFLDELHERNYPEPLMRAGGYPAEETMRFHRAGMHKYLVNKRVIDADVIISVPKLKTHQKVGITCAIKGTVGTIGRKECLAHYRRGGKNCGGDEYLRSNPLNDFASWLNDKSNAGKINFFSNTVRIASKILTELLRTATFVGANWYGNDTTWRMAADIARLLRFGRQDGTLSSKPVRRHIALVDGIIAGEGQGPYLPSLRRTGSLIFGADICAVDTVCAFMMGFDPSKIPLIKNSYADIEYPLTEDSFDSLKMNLNGECVTPRDVLLKFAPAFRIGKGWFDVIKADIKDYSK